jgi:hypothetical protein
MVWIALKNGSGQVVKGICMRNPKDGLVYEVLKTSRHGINRYLVQMKCEGGWNLDLYNHEIKTWEVVGGFHTPEQLAAIFGKKVDPDANLPRPMRESFWRMKSKPGTFNYRQKVRLMQDPWYINKFGHLFKETLNEEL